LSSEVNTASKNYDHRVIEVAANAQWKAGDVYRVEENAKDKNGQSVAIEIKRRGEIDGVEQLTRYLELMNRDAALAPVRGIFAAQEIKPQARTLAEDRGIECLILDYEQLREASIDPDSLFW
jgi:RecB family endonuclease NucS